MMYPFLAILLVLSLRVSPSSCAGSRHLLRSLIDDNIVTGGGYFKDVAVELNETNFNEVLRETPASYAIVEFFAHWCPACRNYKPHYEKVARVFNGPKAAHPGIILMTRVDCALKANSKLCDRFSVDRYPLLLWGEPRKIASINSWDGKDGEIESINDGRTAERLLDWINKKMKSSFGLKDRKYEHEHLQSNASDPGQIARAIYDIEEATSVAFDIILRHKMIKAGTRASLIRFLQLLVAHHPSRRCRKGGAEILVNFDDLYPSKIVTANEDKGLSEKAKSALQNFQICGEEVPRGYWMFCRGSRNDTRGFSCGLWVLLHSVSVRVEDEEAQMAFTGICDFIHSFFICEECRQHFYEMCSSVSNPFNKTQDFALWLWSAHNKVNERLMREETTMGTGDPKYPKMIWPPKQLCPACYLPSKAKDSESNQTEWNKDEVFKFLAKYYGNKLVSLITSDDSLTNKTVQHTLRSEEITAPNAVVVPIGAALAIALASCAFGALACFWRSQQKSRKYRHLHSLKKI